MKLRKATRIAAVAAILSISACTTVSQNQSVGDYVKDSVITSRVKAELIKAESVSGYAIEVETYNRVVQLSGFVNKHADRIEAIKVARGTEGVEEVRDAIIVKR